jgi:uridine kinase
MHGVSVQIPLLDTIIVIGGNSSSGKTFIKDTATEFYNDEKTALIQVFDYKRTVDLSVMKALRNRLIIIDNADILLSENEDVSNFINTDTNNQYLLFMRDDNDVDFSVDNYAELQETGKQLKAVYPFR